MKIKNQEELYEFLSTLDEKNMSEYFCKEFFKLREPLTCWSLLPMRAKVLSNIVYWSGSKNDRKMLNTWKYNINEYLFKLRCKEPRIEARKILKEMEMFVKK